LKAGANYTFDWAGTLTNKGRWLYQEIYFPHSNLTVINIMSTSFIYKSQRVGFTFCGWSL